MDYRGLIYQRYATQFQDAGETFDRTAARTWAEPYRRYLRDWLPADPAASILEVACGGGRLLHALSAWGYAGIEGVDLSPEQVALSRQAVAPERVHHANVLDFLEGRTESYDLIIGLDLIEHLSKDECIRFLDACRSALRPGGRLVLQTPNADSPWGMASRYNDLTHEIGFNPNLLARMMKLSGLEACEARECGPVPHGLRSALRWFLWKGLRLGMMGWNLVEIGHPGSGVFTRNMLVSAVKPAHA